MHLGGVGVQSVAGFGCKLIAAVSTLKREFFSNFMTSQTVVVVFCELPAAFD
jgi:hypothetical protein